MTGFFEDSGTPTVTAHGLSEHTDVQELAPQDGYVLKYSGSLSAWQAQPEDAAPTYALDELTDVNAPSPSDGSSLVWVDAASEWQPVAPTPAPGTNFNDLLDVTITTPSNGDRVIYESGIWVNVSEDTPFPSPLRVGDDTAGSEAVLRLGAGSSEVPSIEYWQNGTFRFRTQWANILGADLWQVGNDTSTPLTVQLDGGVSIDRTLTLINSDGDGTSALIVFYDNIANDYGYHAQYDNGDFILEPRQETGDNNQQSNVILRTKDSGTTATQDFTFSYDGNLTVPATLTVDTISATSTINTNSISANFGITAIGNIFSLTGDMSARDLIATRDVTATNGTVTADTVNTTTLSATTIDASAVPVCVGQVDRLGNIMSQTGRLTASVTNPSTGVYELTLNEAAANTDNMIIQVTTNVDYVGLITRHFVASALDTDTFQIASVRTSDGSYAAAESGFYFTVYYA